MSQKTTMPGKQASDFRFTESNAAWARMVQKSEPIISCGAI